MNKTELLIIDDEPQIKRLLRLTLENTGYAVRESDDGKTGLLNAANHPPELILLDVNLPDLSGHEVLKRLREWYSKPIIMLSVIDHEDDIVRALDNGATDYVCKPFRSAELLARIRAAIKKNGTETSSQAICFGRLEWDLIARQIKKDGQPLKFTATEYNLLVLLFKNEGRVLTHQYILKEIWGLGFQNETQYLRVFIGTIRKKIEDDYRTPSFLVTESRIGYRFIGS